MLMVRKALQVVEGKRVFAVQMETKVLLVQLEKEVLKDFMVNQV